MADDNTQNPPATPEEAAKTTAGNGDTTVPDPAKPGEKPGDGEHPKIFTQADLDRVAASVREDVKKQNVRDAERRQQEAQQEELRKKGEFETLANQKQARIDELEAEIAAERMNAVRAEVAAENKLPKEIAELLKGANRDELSAHAKTLAKLILPPRAPEGEGGPKTPVDALKSAEAEKERQMQSGRYTGL